MIVAVAVRIQLNTRALARDDEILPWYETCILIIIQRGTGRVGV